MLLEERRPLLEERVRATRGDLYLRSALDSSGRGLLGRSSSSRIGFFYFYLSSTFSSSGRGLLEDETALLKDS